MDGPVLVNGDYIYNELGSNFGSQAENIKSYIKGTIKSQILDDKT